MTTKKPKRISAPSAPISEGEPGEREFIGDLRVSHVLNLDKTRSMDDPAARSEFVRGRSNIIGIDPGACLVLETGPGPAKEYLVTHAQHVGIFPKASSPGPAGAAKVGYSNTFECVPLGVPYRPEVKVNLPKIFGTVLATVVAPDPDCQKSHTDPRVRVRIRFHWERDSKKPDSRCSCSARVAQPPGGVFIPRVGMEVVVQFIEGNPDRPFVMGYRGALQDDVNAPPLKLGDEQPN